MPTNEAKSRGTEAARVLIVEDDADVAGAMADVLEAEGYVVAIAANGHEALQQLESDDRPDLILLDMMMPLMDGWTFRAEQETRLPIASIPVVLVTADGHARSKASSLKANGYLNKPVTVDRLLDEVARFCGPDA